jgi:hypothetical protein
MGLCKDCKHWTPTFKAEVTPERRRCELVSTAKGLSAIAGVAVFWESERGEAPPSVFFVTAPEFGCSQFEAAVREVFVVEVGAYSDRYVAGVFSSREAAERYVETYAGEIEARALDPVGWELPPGLHPWQVWIGIASGDIQRAARFEAPLNVERGPVVRRHLRRRGVRVSSMPGSRRGSRDQDRMRAPAKTLGRAAAVSLWDDDDYSRIEDDDGDTTSEDDLCERCLHPRGAHQTGAKPGDGDFCQACKRRCRFKESA